MERNMHKLKSHIRKECIKRTEGVKEEEFKMKLCSRFHPEKWVG